MRKLILTTKFTKSFKKFIKKNPDLKIKIYKTLELLSEDCYSPLLSTHKLSGKLLGVNACSCGYNCRIVFIIETNPETNEEEIILIDIGTHDEVY